MYFLRKLLREIHRRSIWQVLGIYLAGSWAVLQVTDSLTQFAGLPEWTPTFALVLLLVGLPIVTATAFIQRGMPALRGEYQDEVAPEDLEGQTPAEVLVEPEKHPLHHERLFTWRNAILGGVGAGTLLVAAVVAYLAMWATGIGPVGSLVAQGVISAGEPVILADFTNSTPDSTLGDVVTAALRADLVQSPVLRLVERASLEDVLRRMQRDPSTQLTPDVAREAAQRDGIKAVLEGEVGSVGAGYILTATIRSAASGSALGAFRVSAAGPDDLIPAIDKLSQDIREKAGESLKNIHTGQPLDQVTTGSLDALRLYSQAEAAFYRGDYPSTLSLLQQAVAADSTFAMAWRLMAVAYSNSGLDPSKMVAAATEAYQHRDHLTEIERYLTEAFYNDQVTGNQAAVRQAYENVLRLDPDNPHALNNLGNIYLATDALEKAASLYERAISGRGVSNIAFQNLAKTLVAQSEPDSALKVLDAYEARYPDDANAVLLRSFPLLEMGRVEDAEAAARSVVTDAARPVNDRAYGYLILEETGLVRGRLADARRFASEAARVGAQAGVAYGWQVLNWAVWLEGLVKPSAEGVGALKDWMADGRFTSLPPLGRDHVYVAETLILAGDLEGARKVIRDFRESVPDAEKSAATVRNIRLLEAMIRARGRDTVGVSSDLQSVQDDQGCWSCYRTEIALAHEWMHRPARAIELHESVLAHLYTWVEINPVDRTAAMLRLGPLYEEVGDTAKAVEAYQRLVDRWGDADADGQTYVRKARERLAALGAAES
ncbi:MAG: tetratricopeptide repeat protein [Gemmatimonadetes bacterium]|nr:tetratricopeptide repeat protein [Gemmatimonadota bacterium]